MQARNIEIVISNDINFYSMILKYASHPNEIIPVPTHDSLGYITPEIR